MVAWNAVPAYIESQTGSQNAATSKKLLTVAGLLVLAAKYRWDF